MTEPVLSRVAEARTLPQQAVEADGTLLVVRGQRRDRRRRFRVTWPSAGSHAACCGHSVPGVFSVYLSKLFNDWNGRFFNALQDKNAGGVLGRDSTTSRSWSFIFIVNAVYRLWLRQYPADPLAAVADRGLHPGPGSPSRTYYRMELTGHGTDNPEQRIEQDINRLHQIDPVDLTLDLHLRGHDARHLHR